jgi:hypothetical protein
MRIVPAIAVLLLSAVTALPHAYAQTRPKAFVCSFTGGFISAYESDWRAGPIAEGLELTFAAFEPVKGRAQLLGVESTSDVLMAWGEHAVNFVETARGGDLTLTTIFLGKERNRRFPAVHSRHVVASGDPVISQLRGSCEAKQ